MMPRNEARKLGFVDGVGCLFSGLRMAYGTHRSLARYYLVPLIFAFILVAAAWVILWNVSDDVVAWLWPEPDNEAWWGIKHFLWRAAGVAVFIGGAFIAAISTTFIFSLLTASVNDMISEKVEGILGTWSPRPFSLRFLLSDSAQGIKYESIRFFMKLSRILPLFILSFVIPVVGHAIYVLVGGYYLCKSYGMDYVDYCAARRGLDFKARLAFAKQHRRALAGLGFGIVLSLMVPFLFVFVWPGAVVGGTILFLKLENELKGTQNV